MKKVLNFGIPILLMMLLSGCTSHWTSIDLKPDGSDSMNPYSGDNKKAGCVAIMSEVRVKNNGLDANASDSFQKRFILNLKDTRIFEAVVQDMPTPKPDKYVSLALAVNENHDLHQGSNVTKGIFIGLSLYLLTPVLPLSYDFESHMLLNATRWDGKTKQYVAKGQGNSSFQLYANRAAANGDVQSKVMSNNLNALMNQLVKDTDFLYGL